LATASPQAPAPMMQYRFTTPPPIAALVAL
jgi:hypothetical protein